MLTELTELHISDQGIESLSELTSQVFYQIYAPAIYSLSALYRQNILFVLRTKNAVFITLNNYVEDSFLNMNLFAFFKLRE